jgi:glycosyl transferase family 25
MSGWPIYIISLQDAGERRKPLLEALEGFGLGYNLFDAIDGRNGLPAEFGDHVDRAKTRENIARDMTDAEYACALSHFSIYRAVADRKLPGAIVFEDDAIPQPLFREFVDEAGYEKADLMLLDYSYTRIWRFSMARLTTNLKSGLISLNPSLNSAYSISATGCAFMVENALPISRTADWPCDVTRIGARACIPPVVGHPAADEAQSNINPGREDILGERYWNMVRPQRGGFENRKWKRWLIKRFSVKLG